MQGWHRIVQASTVRWPLTSRWVRQASLLRSSACHSTCIRHWSTKTFRTISDNHISTPPGSYASSNKTSIQAVFQSLLSCLPSSQASSSDRDGDHTSSIIDLGDILLRAQDHHNVNLLHELAINHGRWSDIVWLVNQLLAQPSTARLAQQDNLYELVERVESNNFSFDHLTNLPVGHVRQRTQHLGPSCKHKLQSVLDSPSNIASSANDKRQHQVLGLVWSAIGTMTIACVRDSTIARGSVRPEILEVLALFHHHGLISPSVYSFNPTNRTDAIQQPVVLHLLSSRIITALSEAEWRARERAAVAGAKVPGADVGSVRLELLGGAVRANIEAIKPELWLELILWSCLHGGWVAPGAEVLDALCEQPAGQAWSAISWRDSIRQDLPFGSTGATDWEALKFDFDTRRGRRAEIADLPGLDTNRTISSEVVTAYVDAFTSNSDASRSIKGVPITEVIARFQKLQRLLLRSGLTLQSGSWDTIMQRLVELDITSSLSCADMSSLVRLSPAIGEEINASSSTDLPSYVFDGNAALLGLLHRALRAQISVGNMSGTNSTISMINNCVDEARYRSISDFFRSRQHGAQYPDGRSRDMFTSNFDGIEYPFFDPQIPLSTIASYIDLLTDTKSFTIGKSLLSAEEYGGIFLPRRLWLDQNISTALARFATAAGDTDLLARVIRGRTRNDELEGRGDNALGGIMNSILVSQLASSQWQSARQLMSAMRETYHMTWDSSCLAVAGKAIILDASADSKPTFARPSDQQPEWSVFSSMLDEINTEHLSRLPVHDRSATLFGILAILSTVDERFAHMRARLSPTTSFHCPPIDSFNTILDVAAQSSGSKMAKSLVMALSGHSDSADVSSQSLKVRKAKVRRASPRHNTVRTKDWAQVMSADGKPLAVRTLLVPNMTTIRIVVRKALEEWRALHSSRATAAHLCMEAHTDYTQPQDILEWAVQTMLATRSHHPFISALDIRRELLNMVEGLGMLDLLGDGAVLKSPEER